MESAPNRIRNVAILGNHLPRQCGIATFTTDLTDALAAQSPDVEHFVLAMNDVGRRHPYPSRVRFEIGVNDLASYRRASDYLNVNAVDLVCVQHEYGIFGGKAGSHLLPLLRDLRMPIVTTLHTILGRPDAMQRRAMDELTTLSDRIVVMSDRGARLLQEVHGVATSKIDVIPHGIPQIPRDATSKERIGLAGRKVILTFGLVSPDKGLEFMIEAMPKILERHPTAVYVILGVTHPHVREQHGETYRLLLEAQAERLGVTENIVFHDRFVSQRELAEFLSAADVYITPYLKEEQITSGTLAYAAGSGKAVIATPYIYARELLAGGCGVMVPFRDANAIAREVNGLFDDEPRRAAMCARAEAKGRSMLWPAVAASYARTFDRARSERSTRLRTAFHEKSRAKRPEKLPAIDLGHLTQMTDDTGLLQHAVFSVPRREHGYCVDDNARGLQLMALLEDEGTEDRATVHALSSRYLAFLEHAFVRERGRFRNFMSYSRNWLEEQGSEDAHARALQALGAVIGRSGHLPGAKSRQSLCRDLFHAALPAVRTFTSPRAWAFASLGIDNYLHAYAGDSSVQSVRTELAAKLLDVLRRASSPDWPWFEESLAYCNAQLPQALMVAGARCENAEMLAAGQRSLEWLWSVQQGADGYFSPVGSNGFYARGGTKALFDQQPIEVASMIAAALEAHRLTGNPQWVARAGSAFDWFLGQNHLQQPLYDASTGGCRDGLHEDRLNENQGAESTLAYLTALVEMRSSERIFATSPLSNVRANVMASVRERFGIGEPAEAVT